MELRTQPRRPDRRGRRRTPARSFTEADVEVSEAIDFAEFYPHAVREYDRRPNLEVRGRGVVLVISPWNFPIAIPCGGIVAALAAGNTVMFKPASDAVLTAWVLCQCFWRAGVTRRQPCSSCPAPVPRWARCSPPARWWTASSSPAAPTPACASSSSRPRSTWRRRPAARTPPSSPTWPTATRRSSTSSTRPSATAARNAAPPRCSSSSRRSTTTRTSASSWWTPRPASGSARPGISATAIGPLIRPPAGDLEQALTTLEPGEEWALVPRHGWTTTRTSGRRASSTGSSRAATPT